MRHPKFESAASDFATEPGSAKTRSLLATSDGPFQEERRKRKLLSALLTKQAEINEGLRDENECIQEQQRALLELLQEKDKQFSILRRNPLMVEGQELKAEGAEFEVAGAYKVQEVLKGKVSAWTSLLRLGVERKSIANRLEEIKTTNYNEKHLMAYQQFKMAMEHFAKYFETVKKQRLAHALSQMNFHAHQKAYSQRVAAVQFVAIAKRTIMNSLHTVREKVHMASRKLSVLKVLTKKVRKKLLGEAFNLLKRKLRSDIQVQANIEFEKHASNNSILKQVMMRSIIKSSNAMFASFNKWRAEVIIEKRAEETESKIERISMISKKLLVLSKFVSISETTLKLHKLAAINTLKRMMSENIESENKKHKLFKAIIILLSKVTQRQQMKFAFNKFKPHDISENKESKEVREIYERCGAQIIGRVLSKKLCSKVFRLVHTPSDTESTSISIYTLTNSLVRLLSSKISSHFFRFSYLASAQRSAGLKMLEGNFQELQDRYERLETECDRARADSERLAGLKLENESCIAKINELRYENAELRSWKAELSGKNSRLQGDNSCLLDQLRGLESRVAGASLGGNVSVVRHEEAVLQLNKAATERVRLNARLSEKEEELINVLKSRQELEELIKESNGRMSEYRTELMRMQSEAEVLKLNNAELKASAERAEKKCAMLQQTLNQKQEEILSLEGEVHELRGIAEKASRVALLEAELEEKCKNSVALASTIDSLANDKQKLVEELEKCLKEMSTLRDKLAKQQEACSIWKERYAVQEEEVRKTLSAASQYKAIIGTLEGQNQELRNSLNKTKSKKSVVKKQHSTESKQMIAQLQDANQKLQRCILEKNEQIDKAKEHVGELTKELVDSSRTIAEQQGRLGDLEERLRRATHERTKLQEKINIVEQEAVMHRKQVEAVLHTRLNGKQEKTALETANNKLRIELNRVQEENNNLREKHMAMADYTKVKGDSVRMQQTVKKCESDIAALRKRVQETEAEKEKHRKEAETHKKLLEQRKEDIQKLHMEMENYAKVLEALERNMEKVQLEKEKAERECTKAIDATNLLRKKYMSIIGVEISTENINCN